MESLPEELFHCNILSAPSLDLVDLIALGLSCSFLYKIVFKFVDVHFKNDGEYSQEALINQLKTTNEHPYIKRLVSSYISSKSVDGDILSNYAIQYLLDFFQEDFVEMDPLPYCPVNLWKFLSYVYNHAKLSRKISLSLPLIYEGDLELLLDSPNTRIDGDVLKDLIYDDKLRLTPELFMRFAAIYDYEIKYTRREIIQAIEFNCEITPENLAKAHEKTWVTFLRVCDPSQIGDLLQAAYNAGTSQFIVTTLGARFMEIPEIVLKALEEYECYDFYAIEKLVLLIMRNQMPVEYYDRIRRIFPYESFGDIERGFVLGLSPEELLELISPVVTLEDEEILKLLSSDLSCVEKWQKVKFCLYKGHFPPMRPYEKFDPTSKCACREFKKLSIYEKKQLLQLIHKNCSIKVYQDLVMKLFHEDPNFLKFFSIFFNFYPDDGMECFAAAFYALQPIVRWMIDNEQCVNFSLLMNEDNSVECLVQVIYELLDEPSKDKLSSLVTNAVFDNYTLLSSFASIIRFE